MAEVTGIRNNALSYPVYGVPWGVVFPLLDADGDLVTGATTPDAEVSLNGDTFADCTNESVEIATNSGVYYLLLTGAEMTADIVTVIAKSATAGMKTTVLSFYPRKLVSLRTGTAQGGAAGSITLDASAGAMDDIWNGCLCVAVIDTLTEARVISDYTGSTQVAAVIPNWNVTPDSDDTFTIYLPEGRQIGQSNLTGILGTIASTPATAGILDVNVKNMNNVAGTAITTIKAVQGLTTADVVTTATNVTTVNGLAANVITAASMNADASAEIADAVWDEDATGHQTGGTFGQAIGDPGADTTTIYQSVVTDAAGTNIAADIIAIEAQTDDIGTAGAGLTAVPWNAAWDAEVQSEVDDALVAQRLDELLNADSDIDGVAPPTVGSVFHELMTKTTGSFTFDQTTDSLEAIRDKETDIETDTAEIGAAGAGLTAINLPDQTMNITGDITGNLSGSVGSVTGAVGSLTANNDKTGYRLDATGSAALTEGYATDGATATLPQLLYMILAVLTEANVSGTTLTAKKLDGAATAATFTLDSATAPTTITRSS